MNWISKYELKITILLNICLLLFGAVGSKGQISTSEIKYWEINHSSNATIYYSHIRLVALGYVIFIARTRHDSDNVRTPGWNNGDGAFLLLRRIPKS